jgi:choline dehydrogenase
MWSGIGPADHLLDCGIEVLIDLPGTGQNLQDHAKIKMQYDCKQSLDFHKIANPLRKAAAGAEWLLFRRGIATSNIWEAGGLVRGNPDVAYPNLQYHFGPLGFDIVGKSIKVRQAFSLNIDHSRPRSRGAVTLDPNMPFAKPKIRFNYMRHRDDIREMIEGIRLARDLVAQPAFDAFRGAESRIGADLTSDADLELAVRAHAETAFHPSCTCRMGHDQMAVVDGTLRVHGVRGLRVVDASVMPDIASANLNAPVMMIAARAADFILGNPQRDPVLLAKGLGPRG